jgi:PhnB protein
MEEEMPATITPYLTFRDASQAIEFYRQAFDAVEQGRLDEDGKVSHAEILIHGVQVYLSDEYPEIDVRSPETLGGSPVMLVLDVEDADSVFNQAIAAGATETRPLQDSFDGALRTGKFVDPFGHHWMVTTQRGEINLPHD